MSAAALALDFAPLFAAPVRPAAFKFWMFIFQRGGDVRDHKREDIAAALHLHKSTITECSDELEKAGLMTGTNRGQGRPKWYRCRQPDGAEIPSSSSRETRPLEDGKPDFKQSDGPQESANPTSGDLFENAPVAARQTLCAACARPISTTHGVAAGHGIDSRASNRMVLTSTLEISSTYSNRSGETNEKPPEKEKPKPRPRAELRAQFPAGSVETVEQYLMTHWAAREESLPPLGPHGDPIAVLLLTEAREHGWDFRQLQGALNVSWRKRYDLRTGEPLPRTQKLTHWGYLLRCLQSALPDKMAPQREAHEAQPRDGAITDPENRALMDDLLKKTGGA